MSNEAAEHSTRCTKSFIVFSQAWCFCQKLTPLQAGECLLQGNKELNYYMRILKNLLTVWKNKL